MTQNEIEKLVRKLTAGFDEVNVLYIKKIAKQIKKIGELNPTSVHRIAIMAEMNEDIAEINRLLADVTSMTVSGIHDLYTEALNSIYYDPRFERALQEAPLPEASKKKLENLAQMIARQTSGSMKNLSNATALTPGYQKVVDRAILTVTSGMGDYKTAMRDSIRSLGASGMQVQYASGYHRRLDSSVRQNILDGTRQIAQQGSMMMGEMLDYDAYEISAHARSAPDHEPVQGRVFLIEEFNKLQNDMDCMDINGKTYEGFPRSIGEWNCMHIVMSFSTKYSKPRYTEEQLRKFAEDNAKGCMIDGRHYTLYEASQLMRKIEVQIRSQKDTAVAARIVDDEVLRRECQLKIDALSNRYTKIADASGIKPRRDRMRVQGFKPVSFEQKKNDTLHAETDGAVDWGKTVPITHSQEELDELRAYAENNGIHIKSFEDFDGDSRILRDQIDTMRETMDTFGIQRNVSIQFSNKMDDGEFAETGKDIITFNVKTLRNAEITNQNLSVDNQLSSTDYRGIAAHEVGHLFSRKIRNSCLDIVKQAYYNVYGEKIEYTSIPQFLEENVSIYASDIEERNLLRPIQPKFYQEIIPEVIAKDVTNRDAFTEEFTKLLKEMTT